MITFARAEPGRMYSADDFNRLIEAVEQIANLTPDPSMTLDRVGGASYLSVDVPDLFPAKITGQIKVDTTSVSPLSCRYSWVEMVSTLADCPLAALSGGRAGFADFLPIKSLDASTTLTTDSIVWVTLSASRDHYLIVGGGGSGSGYNGVRPVARCIDCDTGAIVYVTDFLWIVNGIITDVTAAAPDTGDGPPVDDTDGAAPDGPGGPWFDEFGCDQASPPA